MPNPALEKAPNYPFSAFNFSVEIYVEGSRDMICAGAFSDCDGLEMTMEAKTLREGGNNGEQIRLAGPLTYGTLTLKRGMTANLDLWDWFSTMTQPGGAKARARAVVVLLAADGTTERARFVLKRCLPVKLKAPPLNAKEGVIAVEEFQMVYESLTLERPS